MRKLQQRRISVVFTGKVVNEPSRRRRLVKIAHQSVWLIPSHHRVLFQLALRKARTKKKSGDIGWMHQDFIHPGGPDMFKIVTKIRDEFKNHGLSPAIILSNGECYWRLDTPRWLIHWHYQRLFDTLDDDLKRDLEEYIEWSKKQ